MSVIIDVYISIREGFTDPTKDRDFPANVEDINSRGIAHQPSINILMKIDYDLCSFMILWRLHQASKIQKLAKTCKVVIN